MKCPNCRRDLPNTYLRCPYCNSLTTQGYPGARVNTSTQPIYNSRNNNRGYYHNNDNYSQYHGNNSYNYYGDGYYDYPADFYYEEPYRENKDQKSDINHILISMGVFIIGMQVINLLVLLLLILRQ